MPDFHRTTLFKAVKREDGKLVCLDRHELLRTTKVVATRREWEIAIGQGWAEDPQEAMRRLQAEEDYIAVQAAVSASDDKHLSQKAQDEVKDFEASTLAHVLEIPEAPRKRGRPRKIAIQ